MKTAGYLPVKSQMYKEDNYKKINPNLSKLKEFLEKGVHRPAHPDYTQISSIITPHIHYALLGEKSFEKAIENAAVELRENNFPLIDSSIREK